MNFVVVLLICCTECWWEVAETLSTTKPASNISVTLKHKVCVWFEWFSHLQVFLEILIFHKILLIVWCLKLRIKGLLKCTWNFHSLQVWTGLSIIRVSVHRLIQLTHFPQHFRLIFILTCVFISSLLYDALVIWFLLHNWICYLIVDWCWESSQVYGLLSIFCLCYWICDLVINCCWKSIQMHIRVSVLGIWSICNGMIVLISIRK
jgi:hypothetical protein